MRNILVLLQNYMAMHNYNINPSNKASFISVKTFFEGNKLWSDPYKSNKFKILLFLFYLYVFPELFFRPQENEMPALSQFDVWCLKKWPGRKKKSKKKSKPFLLGGTVWLIFDTCTNLDISITFIFIKMPAEVYTYVDYSTRISAGGWNVLQAWDTVMFYA